MFERLSPTADDGKHGGPPAPIKPWNPPPEPPSPDGSGDKLIED